MLFLFGETARGSSWVVVAGGRNRMILFYRIKRGKGTFLFVATLVELFLRNLGMLTCLLNSLEKLLR